MTADWYWQQYWSGWLGIPGTDRKERLRSLHHYYQSPERHYHTLNHIEECFTAFAHIHEFCIPEIPPHVAIAIWMHDAIQEPWSNGSVDASRKLFRFWAKVDQMPQAAVDNIDGLIAATAHRELPKTYDQAIIQDIDLAILGSAPERYQEYSGQIREEYQWVPLLTYRARRSEILVEFLKRPKIYHVFTQLEEQAQKNIAAEIRALTT